MRPWRLGEHVGSQRCNIFGHRAPVGGEKREVSHGDLTCVRERSLWRQCGQQAGGGETWSRKLGRRFETVRGVKRQACGSGTEEGGGKMVKQGAKAGL